MPSNAAGRKAVLNVWNSDGNIVLISLTHPDITTQRLAMSTSDVTVAVAAGASPADGTYTAYPFELEPVTDDKGVPRGALRISNVTSLIWNLVGSLDAPPPQLNIYRVLESDATVIQDSFLSLDVKRVAANMLTIECEFGHENYASEPYPAARVVPPLCPWLQYLS